MKKFKYFTAVILLSLGMSLGTTQIARAIDPAGIFADSNATQYRDTGGVVLWNGTAWAILDDTDHNPHNLASVTCKSNGDLQVNYTNVLTAVNYASSDSDEAYVEAGYDVGASVGTSYTILRFAKDNAKVSCAASALHLSGSNVWLYVRGEL